VAPDESLLPADALDVLVVDEPPDDEPLEGLVVVAVVVVRAGT
jgi:hypothetical protein